MNAIAAINLVSVGIFGIILSVGFCDIRWTRRKKLFMAGSMSVIVLFQSIVCLFTDIHIVKCLYPIITHIPLMIALCILSGEFLWPVISVLTAYLFCQLRRWLALLVIGIFSGGDMMRNIVELVATPLLLLLLMRFFVPSVRSISRYTTVEKCWFGLVPLLYYGFDYLMVFFPRLLSMGNPAVMEFMSFVCSVSYLIFALRASKAEQIHIRLKQTQEILTLQMAQAVKEIEVLRESWQKTITHRHDLRHHMQYLLSCIENGRLEQAQAYIQEICSEIEAAKITSYCENEAANLIFSAFSKRAGNHQIAINIKAALPQNLRISENDWCVLLSNALENALHSCQALKAKGISGSIDVLSYKKNGNLFLQVINSCEENIVFSHGIPVTSNPGHGIGVRSICAIVKRYGGIYTFSVKNGLFVLRVSI